MINELRWKKPIKRIEKDQRTSVLNVLTKLWKKNRVFL